MLSIFGGLNFFFRILSKFLDNYLEDLLPWHESIEPCLSSMTAYSNEREV